MKASKKLLSLLLVVMLLVSAIPFQVFADEGGGEDETPAPVTVPVTVEFDGKSYDRSFDIPVDGAVVLTEDFALTGSGVVSNPDTKEFAGWFNPEGKDVTDKSLSYSWVKGQKDYSLTLKLNKKSENPNPDGDPDPAPDPAPTTYTATLKATLDGTEVGSATRTGITSIDLTEELAKSLYSGFNASTHEFKGWAGGVSGTQTLTADATFTAVFETIPVPTYDVTVNVYRNNRFVTSQVVTDRTSVTLNNAFLKDVYADFDATSETAQWYRGALGQNAVGTGTEVTLTANATYAVNITPIVDVQYHNIKVYAVKYVGSVNRGVVSTPIFDSGNIEGTVNVLDYLESTENWGVIETNANKIGKIRTNPTFYTDKALTTKLKNETLTDASKVVYVRVDVEEVKNVLLYVHKGTDIKKLTDLDPKVLHGYEAGDYVTYEAVQSVLGSSVKFYGLFTEERWDNLNASIKDDALPKIQVTANGVEIHVWVYSGSVSNADSTNPKTGDYILDTAVTLMVISGLAAAAVYVVGKKRRV